MYIPLSWRDVRGTDSVVHGRKSEAVVGGVQCCVSFSGFFLFSLKADTVTCFLCTLWHS